MRVSYSLAFVATLAIAAPAPKPSAIETDPLTGLLSGVTEAFKDASSLLKAIPAVINDIKQLKPAASKVEKAIADGTITGTDIPVVVSKLFGAVQPTATPTSISQAISAVNSQLGLTNANSGPSEGVSENLIANSLGLILNGLTNGDINAIKAGASSATNSANNNNPQLTSTQSFYSTSKSGSNAPYSIPEAQLRSAMYIPPAFTWGKKQPVLMSPGTGATGGINFESNIGKLLSASTFGDPVYLNIPNNLLSDAQINAEYVSYALRYLSARSGRKAAIVTWSQGSLDTQWAFKYWPSTQSAVTDHIAISPDYHGTILAYAVCPGFKSGDDIACTPSLLQQEYNSNFVTRLRLNGGDQAYVPVTTIYSATDEIVQPQQGTAASGFIGSSSKAETSNTFLQGACAGLPAGGIYTHEGVLYNSVAWALVKDALTHDGPGDFSRVSSSCGDVVAPGLSLSDVLETEALIPLAVLNILSYLPKSSVEPALKSYATF